MLDIYVYDYLLKTGRHGSAAMFSQEAGITESLEPPTNVPEGFLLEWWVQHSDSYEARHKESYSDHTAVSIEDQIHTNTEEIVSQSEHQSSGTALSENASHDNPSPVAQAPPSQLEKELELQLSGSMTNPIAYHSADSKDILHTTQSVRLPTPDRSRGTSRSTGSPTKQLPLLPSALGDSTRTNKPNIHELPPGEITHNAVRQNVAITAPHIQVHVGPTGEDSDAAQSDMGDLLFGDDYMNSFE